MAEQSTSAPTLDDTARFVETMGLLWEGEGLPRIAGRIFGFLMLQPEPASLDTMAASLGVSKASISTDARRLEQLGLITRVGRPGDRRDYYAIADDVHRRVIALKLEGMQRFETALGAVVDPERLDPVAAARLARLGRAQRLIVAAFNSLLDTLAADDSAPTTHTERS